MAAMRHPNIVGFLGVVAAPPCVVTEFCARGAVSDILRVARLNPAVAEKLDWYRRVSMVRRVVPAAAAMCGWRAA